MDKHFSTTLNTYKQLSATVMKQTLRIMVEQRACAHIVCKIGRKSYAQQTAQYMYIVLTPSVPWTRCGIFSWNCFRQRWSHIALIHSSSGNCPYPWPRWAQAMKYENKSFRNSKKTQYRLKTQQEIKNMLAPLHKGFGRRGESQYIYIYR